MLIHNKKYTSLTHTSIHLLHFYESIVISSGFCQTQDRVSILNRLKRSKSHIERYRKAGSRLDGKARAGCPRFREESEQALRPAASLFTIEGVWEAPRSRTGGEKAFAGAIITNVELNQLHAMAMPSQQFPIHNLQSKMKTLPRRHRNDVLTTAIDIAKENGIFVRDSLCDQRRGTLCRCCSGNVWGW